MAHRPPRMLRQRERNRSDRAFVLISGKKVKLGVWGSERAEQRYRELIAGLLPTTLHVDSEPVDSPSIAELIVAFMRHINERFACNRIERDHFRGALRVLKEEDFAHLSAAEFGPRRLKQVQAAMVAKGWSRRYINGQIARVRRMFKWAVADERIAESVWRALEAVEGLRMGRTTAPEPAPVPPVADEMVEATLPHLNRAVADMVRVQRLCGCRPCEVCMMASQFIDRTGDVWLYQPPKHKTRHHGKGRTIALGPKAQAILQKYLFLDGEFFPYDVAGYRQCIRRACQKAWPAPDDATGDALKAWRKAHLWRPN